MSRWMVGDTQPDMVIDCFDAQGLRPDFTQAQILRVEVTQAGVLKWQRNVTGDANGTIVMPLQTSDTAVPGTYYVKVYAEWADGSRQHYPPASEYMTMTVSR